MRFRNIIFDFDGASNCGVTYGNGSIAELKDAGADYIISDFSALHRIQQQYS